MSGFGIDYAWGGPPSAQALRSAGVLWAGRYLSFDAGKNINAAELRFLQGLGIGVVLAWETTADRALAGEAAGRSDAQNAVAQCKRLGLATVPVHFAIDFDAEGPEVEAYFRGAASITGALTGAYGGYRPLKHLFDAGIIHHGWQTYAWSGGLWDHRALFRQYSNGHVLGVVSCDYDVMLPGPKPPAPPYVNAQERNWIREWDRIQGRKAVRYHLRRVFLKRQMGKRRELIWRTAEARKPHGWEELDRKARYEALRARTSG